jgi:integrase
MAFITAIDEAGRTIPRGSKRRAARYVARWRTPDGQSRERRFTRKIDAERHLLSVEHRKLTGDYIDEERGRMLFGDYADAWLERKRATVRPSTAATYSAHLDRHLRPALGSVELRAITRERVKTIAASLPGKMAPTTARAVVFTLAAILREAVDDNRISRNPAERITAGARTERRVDPMHVANLAAKVPAIADAMPPRWRVAVILMATTGLRLGECLGLTVDRVDFLRRTVRVDRQLVKGAGGMVFGPPKTRAGVRAIPVPALVTDLLAAHLAQFPAGQDGLIFTTSTGAPVPRSNWSDRYRAACVVAAVEGRTRSHDLRHVAASALIASGLSVAAVQAVLGHASPAETLEVYTHFWPADEDRTRGAIEAAAASWMTGTS